MSYKLQENMRFIKQIIIYLLFLTFALPLPMSAAMQSSNYIIYENVMHSFDGPVISGVSSLVSGAGATISWTTNVAADSFVIYDTDSNFLTSHEQGNSAKTFTSHSVSLSGLAESTTYYYRVRSERVNGGITTDTASRSFTTGSTAVPPEEEEAEPAGGGGILIIDKTDKTAPEISNVAATRVSSQSAAISWETDEAATSFVEYGRDAGYGSTYGAWASSTEHNVILDNLDSEQRYYFRVLSSDAWGNVGYSEQDSFTTGEAVGEEEEVVEEEDEAGILADAAQIAFDFISRIFPAVSLNLRPDEMDRINNVEDLQSLVSAPVLSGEPRVEIGATEATVYWTTDIESNSQVAIAPIDRYNPGANEPYLQVVGNLEEFVNDHEVTVYGLTPDTEYHYQLRSKAEFGPTSRSRDFIFNTSLEELSITSFFPQVVDDQTAIFKWVTNKNSDTALTFAPYEGNVLAVDKAKTFQDNALTVIHEVTVSEFVGGTKYKVELQSMDEKGNIAAEEFDPFSTAEDDLPPKISHIKADSTVFLDRGDKIQTIISWLTNEPSTSRVYFKEGVHGSLVDLTESTRLNIDYSKEHVIVVTKFKPGLVYSFRAESTDSGGNTSLSKVHTFMTAKKQESIIQMIIRILGDSFGWIRKII
ncbi:MAG: fibronectin type III domain-containing protein [Patescibacteria group bacterium]|nr:fibronectin type III domain-containing protein [Patescibacteria group bacterium]